MAAHGIFALHAGACREDELSSIECEEPWLLERAYLGYDPEQPSYWFQWRSPL